MFAIVRALIGAVFGVLCAFALSPALAAFHSSGTNTASVSTLAVVATMGVLGFFAPTIRRAFGRGFLMLGLCFFALPLSTILLSGRAANEVVTNAAANDQAVAAVGAGLAGIAVTGVATFIGLIVGTIFVILGLVLALGGRREVIVINR
ncbi:hypothetical protein LO749_09345 [Paracoccus denitrificans]|uniref:hypothetical protein n=1 Tax=Paracoccus denitrificans TaxID=266 RepID=UPI001E5C9B8C|nr:hypothetical protein [Paracoccus denitrificans]UFS64372.1 hypothetical protein LO749_09345 [Paracoccus denitrificans]